MTKQSEVLGTCEAFPAWHRGEHTELATCVNWKPVAPRHTLYAESGVMCWCGSKHGVQPVAAPEVLTAICRWCKLESWVAKILNDAVKCNGRRRQGIIILLALVISAAGIIGSVRYAIRTASVC